MGPYTSAFTELSDRDLLREVTRLAARERHATASLIASLAELDDRQLYLGEGYSSMFEYCTPALHLSEGAAYKRISVVRAARRFPAILMRLAEGTVNLTTIKLLACHLTDENHVALLDEVRHRSTREVESIIARLQPRPDVPSSVRKLPTRSGDTGPRERPHQTEGTMFSGNAAHREAPLSGASNADLGAAEAHRPLEGSPATAPPRAVTPLAPGRYKVSFAVGAETLAKLREAQDLMRHVIPNGDVSVLFDRALTVLLREVAKTKRAATESPRANGSSAPGPPPRQEGGSDRAERRSRRIPAEVRRRVWERDRGRCTFVGAGGRLCTQREFLEYHHIVPYAMGGEPSVGNTTLRCRRHNLYQAERDFGPWKTTGVRERRPGYGPGVVPADAPPAVGTLHHVFAERDAGKPTSRGRTPTGRAARWFGQMPVNRAPTALAASRPSG